MKFVREHKDKEKSDWERVLLWTDESKIELFGRNSRNHEWRDDGHTMIPSNQKIQLQQQNLVVAASLSEGVFLQMILATSDAKQKKHLFY